MNMKKLFVLAAGLWLCGWASAQNYELAEQFTEAKVNRMVFSTSVTPNWFHNSDTFWYKWKDSDGMHYFMVNAADGRKKEIFNRAKLAMELTTIVKDPFDAQHIPFKKLKLSEDDKSFTFEIKSTNKKDSIFRFSYDIASGRLTDVTASTDGKEYPDWANVSPDGTKAVYCKNHDLYWMTMEDLEKLKKDEKDSTVVDHRITTDATASIYYGGDSYRADKVKDEDDRMKADIYWAPDGRHFAVVRIDATCLKQLWVINSVSQPRPTLKSYNYQMPGEPGATEDIYIFNTDDFSSSKVDVTAFKDQDISIFRQPQKQSEKDAGYTVKKWLGDDNSFYMSRFSRDQKRHDLCRIAVGDSAAKVVIEERMNTYVEIRDPKLINNGQEIVWWSERNGWANLYLYGADGTLKRNLTEGDFHVEDICAVDEKAGIVYFLAMGADKEENPYNGHVYSVSLEGKGMKRLDETPYNSTVVSFSDDAKYFVATFSRVDCAPKVAIFSGAGRKIASLEEADFSLLLAAGYKFPEPFKVKAADGITDLYGYMYKPFDFDSTKKYPIIDYVYPGPQVEGNSEAWSKGFLRRDRLAQIGFIVITVGNRGGHPNRSKWYHNYGYGNLRDYGLADQKYAIQQLAARHSFIDIDRVGIHGHSGGGFMSTAAILKYPDFFKAAVSCAGNHDNRIYNRWWSEQHHGVEEIVSADGDTTFKYKIKTNQEMAKNLKGHLLLVHGDYDDNVNPANTIRVVDALIRANKRFDMLILPGQKHGFGDMNEYFFWRLADWYSQWLLGSSRMDEVDISELNNDR